MKKETHSDDAYFQEMLKATSTLRKEQEEEMRIHERLMESRKFLQETDMRFVATQKRLNDLKHGGTENKTAHELLGQVHADVRDMQNRRETLEGAVVERELHLEKLLGWEKNDRMTTEDDVRAKRDQVYDMEDQVKSLQEQLDQMLEKNTKLVVFRQASAMQIKRLREKEDEFEKLLEEKRRISKLTQEKEEEMNSKGRGANNGRVTKSEVKRFGIIVRDKIDKFRKMKEEINKQQDELVILQRTEQLLKMKNSRLDEFNADLEKSKGVEGYRDTQKALENMAEQTAEIDQTKGFTLEQMADLVTKIAKQVNERKSVLAPLVKELKSVKAEYLEVETIYKDKKSHFDKVAVGFDMEKSQLEKDCDAFQEECLREESRFHYLNSLTNIARIKLERAEQEKKWQSGDGRMMRDFTSFKELYQNKLSQQEQLTKQLRKYNLLSISSLGGLSINIHTLQNITNLHAHGICSLSLLLLSLTLVQVKSRKS